MKKITILVALIFISAISFAQVKKANETSLKAVKVLKHINTTASNTKAVVDSLHYDGDNGGNAIGTGAASTFGVYAFFPASVLAGHNAAGNTISSVKVYIDSATTYVTAPATLKIYSDTGVTELRTQTFTAVNGWNNVVLTTPLAIPTTNLYIGYNITTTGGYPAGCDDATAPNPNGNWINFGGSWKHLNQLSASLTFNWNIRALVSGTVLTTPVANCTPLAWNAGDVVVPNTLTSADFILKNVGGGSLTVTSITGLTAPFTTTLIPASVNLSANQTVNFTFTYSPTAAGPSTQTVTVTTNAGPISISLSGNGVQCNTVSTFPWSESFEGATFPPACWTKANPDGGTGWASVANGTTPIPGWNGGTMTVPTGGGTKAAYVTWNTGGTASNDQWLITPKIAVPAGKELTFQVFRYGSYQDIIDVKVSTLTNATADFATTLLSLDSNLLPTTVWVPVGASLSAFATQNIYLAFNEHIADNQGDGAFIAIDLVKIDAATGVAENSQDFVSIFPNPANSRLCIAANRVQTVEIFNLTGAKVASYGSQNSINISDLAQGTYLVRVVTDTKVTTQKINIVR
ncbi:MAG: choice-of-anchor J domain-containing protein [Bacteroidota bacterium]